MLLTYPSEVEAPPHNIYELRLYHEENTRLHHYKDQYVNVVYENIPVYFENHIKSINTK
jgi:hypothetical protein